MTRQKAVRDAGSAIPAWIGALTLIGVLAYALAKMGVPWFGLLLFVAFCLSWAWSLLGMWDEPS